MRCRVLLFAELADAIGRRAIDVELADGATVADALETLGRTHAAIAERRTRLAVAVDEVYQPPDATLADGSTIALIPPVSGG